MDCKGIWICHRTHSLAWRLDRGQLLLPLPESISSFIYDQLPAQLLIWQTDSAILEKKSYSFRKSYSSMGKQILLFLLCSFRMNFLDVVPEQHLHLSVTHEKPLRIYSSVCLTGKTNEKTISWKGAFPEYIRRRRTAEQTKYIILVPPLTSNFPLFLFSFQTFTSMSRSRSLFRPSTQGSARPSILWTGQRSGATLSPSLKSSGTTMCRRQCTASRSPARSGTPTNRSRDSYGWSTKISAKVGHTHRLSESISLEFPLNSTEQQSLSWAPGNVNMCVFNCVGWMKDTV